MYIVTNKKLIIKVGNDIEMYQANELLPMKIQMYKIERFIFYHLPTVSITVTFIIPTVFLKIFQI